MGNLPVHFDSDPAVTIEKESESEKVWDSLDLKATMLCCYDAWFKMCN